MQSMTTIVCIGTGPSLTSQDIGAARDKGFTLYACNNAIFVAPDAALLYAVNTAWWDHYWPEVMDLPCEKWTTNAEAAERYGLNWIAEKNAPGLSMDPDIIHHGHGSGYSLVSMAHRAKPDRIVLLGYDLKYAPDYDGKARKVGSEPRHFFGEYPASMQHWPSQQVHGGIHVELLDLYRSIAAQNVVEVVNCTPGSAIDCFPHREISEL
jgi:hypothetical protein